MRTLVEFLGIMINGILKILLILLILQILGVMSLMVALLDIGERIDEYRKLRYYEDKFPVQKV